MRLLAGFDAGQTQTRCRLSVVQNGLHQPVGEGEGPGVSHLDAPQGERRFLEAISTSAQEALKNHPDGVIQAALWEPAASNTEQRCNSVLNVWWGKPWPSVMTQA